MAIIARPGPVFYVFGPKISRTFWGKCTEQSSRTKLAVGGFEPEKVRLLYPAPLKTSLLSTTIKVRFLQYFIQNERKSSKIRVIQGLGVVNWTAPRPFFRFQSRKIAKSAGWGCCNRINNGRAVCDSHHVNEDVLEAAYLTAMQRRSPALSSHWNRKTKQLWIGSMKKPFSCKKPRSHCTKQSSGWKSGRQSMHHGSKSTVSG